MTESESPKEIERKFRVDPDALPFRPADYPSRFMEQGYLAVEESQAREVRVRNREGEFTLTVKTGAGPVRGEGEVEVSEEQFRILWPFTEGRRIEKTRYEIDLEALTAELDVYGGLHEGLAVVEVEFPDEGSARDFDPPDWFGGEVTGNEAYKNQRLAVTGRKPEETE